MLKKIWHDTVWSKVISVGILAIFIAVGSYFIGCFPTRRQWIVAETTIPNWILLISCIVIVWKLVKVVYHTMRKRDKFTKKEHNEIANMEHVEVVSTASQTDTPVRKTPKMKLPDFSFTVGYGNTLTPENLDRLTSEPASYQVVDELIINVLRKDGIPRTLLDIQRKTNMSEAVIRSSLRRLFTHGLVALDATDGTQLERYSIIQNSAPEGEIEAQ